MASKRLFSCFFAFAFFSIVSISFAGSQQSFYLDEFKELSLSVGMDPSGHSVSGTLVRDNQLLGIREKLPAGISSGIEIFVNGETVPKYARSAPSSEGNAEYEEWSKTISGDVEVEFKLYETTIAKFEVKQNGDVSEVVRPRILSAFDIRRFTERGAEHALEWRRYRPLYDPSQKGVTSVDLHTHFAGAMRAETVWQAAFDLGLPYPTSVLEKRGIDFSRDSVFSTDDRRYVRLRKDAFSPTAQRKFFSLLAIDPVGTVAFDQMESIYEVRLPIVRNIEALPIFLNEIANDYAKMGVSYAELSASNILDPKWRDAALRALPEIERRTGVKLRFLVCLKRYLSNEFNLKMTEKVAELASNPDIVGVDFAGQETNRTSDFAPVLEKLREIRKRIPSFQIRVHAGENPTHSVNVREAIELGATRIGHGLYGVTPEVLRLARKKGVIIEFNANSNLALQNIQGREQLPIRDYLDVGVRVTLGTDGHGIYRNSANSEIAVFRGLGITDAEIAQIVASDKRYVREMETARDLKIQAANRVGSAAQKCASGASSPRAQ